MDRPAADTAEPNDLVLIAANPRAGAGSPVEPSSGLASVLRHYKFRVNVFTDLDAVTAAAERAWQAGELRALVAAGGDGTVAELVNRTAVGLPITVFPLGTANLLAGYLNIYAKFQPFARMLRRGATVRLDAGQANGRIFLLMVGCGFDAEVVHRLHSTRGGHISMWSYAKPIIESIRSYQYPELRSVRGLTPGCCPGPRPPAVPALPVSRLVAAATLRRAALPRPLVGPASGDGRRGSARRRWPAGCLWSICPAMRPACNLPPARWGPTENWRWRHFVTDRFCRGFAI